MYNVYIVNKQGVIEMGQARNRKAEIAALKAKGPKYKECVMFGCFYKAKADDGINLVFNKNNELKPGFTTRFHNLTVKAVASELADHSSGKTKINVQEVRDQLHSAIHNYNLLCFNQTTQPTRGYKTIEIKPHEVKEFAELITVIATDIMLLTELGEIVEDDDNGIMVGYTG